MPNDSNARSGSLVEAHTTFQPRVFFFYFMVAVLLLVLGSGLAYQQLIKSISYNEAERVQNQRRVLVPGPRGNIYDREGRMLVGNRPRFAVVLYLDELRPAFREEARVIRRNYLASGDKELPGYPSIYRLAQTSVVQRHLDQVNAIIGRQAKLDPKALHNAIARELLLPFVLINDLSPEEYARLIEKLPVKSPLQVYTNSVRYYPRESMAAHTLGYVKVTTDVETEDFPGEDLTTFRMKGAMGAAGLEAAYDSVLQGEPGGTIFRVDPAGYRINPPLERRLPVQGRNIITSLDIDLQEVAETALGDLSGAAVMMEVNTGEVLVLASKPDYNLGVFAPSLSKEAFRAIDEKGAWLNRAVSGIYMPGSTFKLITAMAGLRKGTITPASDYETNGIYTLGRKVFRDHRGALTGLIDFRLAIEHSVNTYFFHYGVETGIDAIAEEARRFHMHEKTGIELPNETGSMLVGTPEWKMKRYNEPWSLGDTANVAIGQGYIAVTPLQMACFVSSLARRQCQTKPTLIHQAGRAHQKSEPIGLSSQYLDALFEGMERVVSGPHGTARGVGAVEGLRIAGKTGTAQVRTSKGTIELAWYVGFAPADKPEVAFTVIVEGDTPDESFAGGRYAAPVAQVMLKKWLEKKRSRNGR